jgi:hypothetical protein
MFTFLEALFLLVTFFNLLVPGRWAPKWWKERVQPHQPTFFTLHGPACALVLYFATGDNQWKYIPASVLVCLLYDFGFIFSAEWFTVFNIVMCGSHHLGPIVAFYFQRPEEAWLNAMLYFQIWYIHGFGFLRSHILPALGLGEIERKSTFDYWLHLFYAVMTPITYAFYVQYMPVGWNYATLALFLQVFGRYTVAGNLKNYDWMRRVEAPGVLAVACYSFGGLKVVIPVLLTYVTSAYFFIEKTATETGCSKLVLTDEIREFMRTFPEEEPLTEEKKEEGAKWFDAQPWAAKHPLVRAVMQRENAKVAQMLKEGADHSAPNVDWWNSVPMQWAASGGGVSTMKVLIEAGANPFHKGVRDGTYFFNQTHARDFYDGLQALAKKDEELVSRVNVELLESPVTFAAAQDLAKSKGGRLVTSQEAELVFAHRAAASPVDGDVDNVSCFTASQANFACKVIKGETEVMLVSGQTCPETSPCSLLMWTVSKEDEESTMQEEEDTTGFKEKAA